MGVMDQHVEDSAQLDAAGIEVAPLPARHAPVPWESLSDAEREGELELTPNGAAELIGAALSGSNIEKPGLLRRTCHSHVFPAAFQRSQKRCTPASGVALSVTLCPHAQGFDGIQALQLSPERLTALSRVPPGTAQHVGTM